MKFTTFENLIEKINTDLADFKGTFAYKRKELANLKKAPNRNVFFKYINSGRNWVINEGGGTEIQYHLFYVNNTIGYGLGFNAQYVPYANEMSPVAYIKPFVSAYLNLLKQENPTIIKLKKDGFSFIEGEEKDLNSIQNDDYFLFGKEIKIDSSNNISDSDYNQMLDYLKNDIYKLYVDIWEEKMKATKTNENMVNAMNLLTANHNLILTGAPGTGKTYLAKLIAQLMIFGKVKEKMSNEDKKMFNEQCGFVQFHPSYDYTDFVEGMRPVQDDGGNVGFERKDGVFKEFCKRAVKNAIDSKKSLDDLKKDKTFEEKYYEIINKIGNGEISKFDLRKGIQMDIVEVSKGDNIILRTHESEKTYTVSLNRLAKLAKIYPDVESLNNISNIDKEIRKVIKGCHSSSYWAVLKAVYEQSSSEKVEVAPIKIEEKNFVFIIDEINRGEISKIFGELFFSIDPGYRGEKGKVKTQYQNLIEEDDEFYDGFYVPENVYIIGTMNDIDRSVESMDFAFRWRFAFKEIKAVDSVDMLYDSNDGIGKNADEAKDRMNRLNKEIEKIEGLSTAYHIGPAYFLKLKNYNGNFQQLWENHLDGLLREYLRGMQNLEEKMKILKAAYDNESDSDNGQQQD